MGRVRMAPDCANVPRKKGSPKPSATPNEDGLAYRVTHRVSTEVPAAGKKNAGGVFAAPGAGRKVMTNATNTASANRSQQFSPATRRAKRRRHLYSGWHHGPKSCTST